MQLIAGDGGRLSAEGADLAGDEVAVTREFDLSGTEIKGLGGAQPRRESAQLPRPRRAAPGRNGSEPSPAYAGWQVTVLLGPQHELELLMRFRDHTDPDTPYMFHCHLLRHEDQGMMGQFAVVEPGGSAGEVHHEGH